MTPTERPEMPRYIDMTPAQRAKVWKPFFEARVANAAAYIADAERDVAAARARLAAKPDSQMRATLLADAEARLAAVRGEG
jgi:hypothetical protein